MVEVGDDVVTQVKYSLHFFLTKGVKVKYSLRREGRTTFVTITEMVEVGDDVTQVKYSIMRDGRTTSVTITETVEVGDDVITCATYTHFGGKGMGGREGGKVDRD